MPVVTNVIKRRQRTWVEVFASGRDSLRLPVERLPSWIAAGVEVPEETWNELSAVSSYAQLYDKALLLLGRREHFVFELRRKLSQRERDRAVVQQVLSACSERGYVDDRRAAEQLAAMLVNRGGIGRARLRSELLARGCEKGLAAEMLLKHGGEIDETAEVRRLLESRRKLLEGKRASLRRKIEEKPGDPRRVRMELRSRLGAAVGAFVYGRGFTSEEARGEAQKFVRELLDDEGSG